MSCQARTCAPLTLQDGWWEVKPHPWLFGLLLLIRVAVRAGEDARHRSPAAAALLRCGLAGRQRQHAGMPVHGTDVWAGTAQHVTPGSIHDLPLQGCRWTSQLLRGVRCASRMQSSTVCMTISKAGLSLLLWIVEAIRDQIHPLQQHELALQAPAEGLGARQTLLEGL